MNYLNFADSLAVCFLWRSLFFICVNESLEVRYLALKVFNTISNLTDFKPNFKSMAGGLLVREAVTLAFRIMTKSSNPSRSNLFSAFLLQLLPATKHQERYPTEESDDAVFDKIDLDVSSEGLTLLREMKKDIGDHVRTMEGKDLEEPLNVKLLEYVLGDEKTDSIRTLGDLLNHCDYQISDTKVNF